MTTRDEMVRTLVKFCDDCHSCNNCLLEKFSGGVMCDFDEWSDDKLAIAYDHVYKNGDDRLNGGYLKESGETPDMVEHPRHYTQGGIECIDAMKSAFGADELAVYCKIAAFKYIWRCELKNGSEDVKKAIWYLNKFLELEANNER